MEWIAHIEITSVELDELRKVASIQILHDEVELLRRLEGGVEVHQAWVLQIEEHFSFDEHLVLLFLL